MFKINLKKTLLNFIFISVIFLIDRISKIYIIKIAEVEGAVDIYFTAYLNFYLGNISIFFQILIVLFNLIIFVVSLREKENELIKSENNLESTKDITH